MTAPKQNTRAASAAKVKHLEILLLLILKDLDRTKTAKKFKLSVSASQYPGGW